MICKDIGFSLFWLKNFKYTFKKHHVKTVISIKSEYTYKVIKDRIKNRRIK